MNLKQIIYLHALSEEPEPPFTGEYPIAFSAVGGTGTVPLRTTNNYGTTLSTTSAENNSVSVTQVYNSGYAPTNYNNGYLAVAFNKIDEWIAAGKTIVFEADMNISANPASATETYVILSGHTEYNISISTGKIYAEFSGLTWNNRPYIEFRCAGCSFTLSNCKLYTKE